MAFLFHRRLFKFEYLIASTEIIGRYFETAILLSGKTLKLSLPCNHEAKMEVASIMEKEINFWKRENGYSRYEEPVIPTAQQQDRSGNDREVGVIQLSEVIL